MESNQNPGPWPKKPQASMPNSNQLLIRAGFLRQAYAGVFHLLPLGLRVQEKLEALIDKHMRSLGASKLSLSSISSQLLWKRSGRLKEDDSEMFRFKDRKDAPFLLAPTHEEEITILVGGLIKSYKDLPLRIYQISRKYRDEVRPRQGLLRGREFLMKDLYTFDCDAKEAIKTYDLVKEAYVRLFNELKLPYLVAAADSGNMGGNLSHEFHLPSAKGEDTVISCTSCNYVFNEELANGRASPLFFQGGEVSAAVCGPFGKQQSPAVSAGVSMSISKDKQTLVRAYYPRYLLSENMTEPVEREINSHAVRSIASSQGIDLELAVKDPLHAWRSQVGENSVKTPKDLAVLDIYDFRVRPYDRPPLDGLLDGEASARVNIRFSSLRSCPGTDSALDIIRARTGDACSKCGNNSVMAQTTIEMGHTFHLGTRYSSILDATVATDPSRLTDNAVVAAGNKIPLQMGCHGIGVSRMISAVADTLADSQGLNWPRVMAPFSVVVVPAKGLERDAEQVYDAIASNRANAVDAILDDRNKGFLWKLGDADLIGFPVILVLGKAWNSERKVEVQCRQKSLRATVSLEELPSFVSQLLDGL